MDTLTLAQLNRAGTGTSDDLMDEVFDSVHIRKPIPIKPLEGDEEVSTYGSLEASTYTPFYDVDERDFRQFQVKKKNDDWENTVIDVEIDQDYLDLEDELDLLTEYVWRCRDRSRDEYYSNWSDEQQFKTSDQYVEAPEIYSPDDGEEDVNFRPTIKATSFNAKSYPDESHVASEWEIRSTSDDSVVYSEVTDGVTEHEITENLDTTAEYEIRVRYEGENLGWSEWSDPVTFTTWNSYVEAPSITSPNDGDDDVLPFPTFEANDFNSVNYDDSHEETEWELRLDDDTLVESVVTDHYLTEIEWETQLDPDTTHKIRARYRGDYLGWSNWSDYVTFTSVAEYVETPELISPEDEETEVYSEPELEASDFNIVDGTDVTDVHIESRWQVSEDEEFSDLVHDTGWQSEDLTSHTIPEVIEESTTYYWRVRYRGETYGKSSWATPYSFTTADSLYAVVEPDLVHPEFGERWEYLYLRGSQFEMNAGKSKHVKTKVEVEQEGSVVWDWEKEDEFDPGYFEGTDQRDYTDGIIDDSTATHRIYVDSQSFSYRVEVPKYELEIAQYNCTLVEIQSTLDLDDGDTITLNDKTVRVFNTGDHSLSISGGNPESGDTFDDNSGVTREIDTVDRVRSNQLSHLDLSVDDTFTINGYDAKIIDKQDDLLTVIHDGDCSTNDEPDEDDTFDDDSSIEWNIYSVNKVSDSSNVNLSQHDTATVNDTQEFHIIWNDNNDALYISSKDPEYDITSNSYYITDNDGFNFRFTSVDSIKDEPIFKDDDSMVTIDSTSDISAYVEFVGDYSMTIDADTVPEVDDTFVDDKGLVRTITDVEETNFIVTYDYDKDRGDWQFKYDDDNEIYYSTDGDLEYHYEYNFRRRPYLISYKIEIPNHSDAEDNAPNTWSIEGSNDQSTWTQLQYKSDIYDWDAGETKEFILDNVSGIGYRYYRLKVDDNNGGSYTDIKDLVLETHTEPNDLEWIEGDDVEDSLEDALQHNTTYDVRIGYASSNDPETYFWSDRVEVTTVEE